MNECCVIVVQLNELRTLDVTGVKSVNDQVVCSIVDGCKGLTSLYLSLCPNVSDVGVKYIAQYTRNLTTLHLVSCSITNEGKTNASAIVFLQYHK